MTSFHVARMRTCLLAAAVAQVLTVAPVVGQTASSTQEPPQENRADVKNAVKLKEVVVTAQRRSQNIQKVPIAVTALDEAQLTSRGINNISDMSAVAPNVSINSAPGTSTASVVAIRGSAIGSPSLYWDAPAAIYLDGVYLGKTTGNVLDLLNLERIEVLRGPQGTLFGRNTMTGAINLVTRPPTGQFTGNASVSFGNFGSKVGKVTMDLPAMGKLKASLGGRIERRDGWVKTTPGSSVSQLGNLHNEEAFAGLEYDATNNLKFNYRFDYTNVNQRSMYFQPTHSDVDTIFGIPGIVVNPGRQSLVSVDGPVSERMRVDGNSLTINWKLGEVGTVKYIGAYRLLHWSDALDIDGSPIAFAHTVNKSRYHQISHELQYFGSNGPWNWVTGLYFFEDGGFTFNPQQYFLGLSVLNPDNYGFGTRSRAAYGQVDYKLTDRLTITAGVRRTLDQKHLSRVLAQNGMVIIPEGTASRAEFGQTTPTLNLTYQVTPDSMVYARYAKGFMAGGFNGDGQSVIAVTTPFKPETQQTYEIGTKNTFLDGRLSLNANVFYNRNNELQEPVLTASAEGGAGTLVLNVGKSHTVGFELEARMRPTEDLTLSANYGYLHGKIDRFTELGVNVADNRAVVYTPRQTANVVIDGVLARSSYGVLHFTVDSRYTASYFLYVAPFTQTTPPQALAQNSLIRSWTRFNGQIAFSDMDWGHGITGEVALWGKNLTDKAHIDSTIDFGPSFGNLRVANYDWPRTYGVTVTAWW